MLLIFLLLGCFIIGNISQSFSQDEPIPYRSLKVTGIAFTATDNVGVVGYLINESALIPDLNDSGWSATPQTEYTFESEGEEVVLYTKTLYAWAKDKAGNISDSKSIMLIIKLDDITKPVITNFSIPPQSASLNIKIKKFAATDDVGVMGYLIKETSSTPDLANENWQVITPLEYVFDSYGTKTLYAWARDEAGNISESESDNVYVKNRRSKNRRVTGRFFNNLN